MTKPTLTELENLVAQVMLPFYLVERDAVVTVGPRRFENDAEHSWSVALLSCAVAPHLDPALDVGRIAQFGLVHDLVEVYAGDTRPWDESAQIATKEAREAAAFERLAREYAHFPWLVETIAEYERKDSEEARLVWAMDKVIILIMRHLDKGQYYVDHKITKTFWDERNVEHRRKAHAHAGVAEYYEALRTMFDEHPEYFYRSER